MNGLKRTTLYFIVLSGIASTLSYLSYPMLSRILPPHDYVHVTVSLSLMTQIGTFMSSLTALTVGLAKAKNGGERIIHKLQTSLLQIFTLFGLLFLLAAPLIMPFASTPTPYAIPIVIMILVSIPITIISGYLNGKSRMTRLGIVGLTVASLQFLAALLASVVSRNGLTTMICMGLVQIISIILLIRLLDDSALPRISSAVFKLESYSRHTKQLLVFIIVSSVGIMLINLLQVFDLLLVTRNSGETAKFYTDIYVISRAVFFAGTIFIWPFLGEISLESNRVNRKAFAKVVGIFTSIGAISVIGVSLFGDTISRLAFGESYSLPELRFIAMLSIIYKVLFLVITAGCLYFIVFRSYLNAILAGICTVILIIAGLVLGNGDIKTTLEHLVAGAGLCALFVCVAIVRHRPTPSLALNGHPD